MKELKKATTNFKTLNGFWLRQKEKQQKMKWSSVFNSNLFP